MFCKDIQMLIIIVNIFIQNMTTFKSLLYRQFLFAYLSLVFNCINISNVIYALMLNNNMHIKQRMLD